MLTHRNLVANALQIANGPLDWHEGEIAAAVPPMFHAYGVTMYFGALRCYGSTVVSMPRFDFEQFLQGIERYKATFAMIVPPVALALAHHPVVDKYDLKSLRSIVIEQREVSTTRPEPPPLDAHRAFGAREQSAVLRAQQTEERRRIFDALGDRIGRQ